MDWIKLKLDRSRLTGAEGQTDYQIIRGWFEQAFLAYTKAGAGVADHLLFGELVELLDVAERENAPAVALSPLQYAFALAIVVSMRPPGETNEVYRQLLRAFR
jgi:hypothetical protein